MTFAPKNRLFTKENVFVQINPQEYGNFSRKCNLHKENCPAKILIISLVDQIQIQIIYFQFTIILIN
jgi:hypothetical protein